MNEQEPPRFTLRKLVISAPGGQSSSIEFFDGLNVIAGPSDTGKTFVLQCIDYMLGSSMIPKEIQETRGFNQLTLSVATSAGDLVTLERDLRGGSATVTWRGESQELAAIHSADNLDNISNFLLHLCALDESRIRTDGHGKTRSLSFRDLSRLVLVGESRIIAEQSPVHTGQRTEKTANMSTFRLLVDGEDDSNTVEQVPAKDLRNRKAGERQVIQDLNAQVDDEIEATGFDLTRMGAAAELTRVDQSVIQQSVALEVQKSQIAKLEADRRPKLLKSRRLHSAVVAKQELHARFLLLQAQYDSDIARLAATAEAGVLLVSLSEDRCPICGSDSEHHDAEHQSVLADTGAVAQACFAEISKLKVLAAGLASTIDVSSVEISQLEDDLDLSRSEMSAIDEEIESERSPIVESAITNLNELHDRRVLLVQFAELLERKEHLDNLLAEANKPTPRVPTIPSPTVRTATADQLARTAESILKSWSFPGLDRISWDPKAVDFVLDGKPRTNFGKGVRAITYCAFTLSLLKFCKEGRLRHPGFVVVDSPLVVYREPDQDEGADTYDVKESFYRSVAREFSESQVIVIENEAPPSDLVGANVITFTRSSNGRAGFVEAG
tara:strand:- start:464 stop:2296 length:1833 start_codon:yes stop_codon:yes gene_type:complete